MGIFGRFSKKKKESLDKGLEKTRKGFFSRLVRAIGSKTRVDAEVLDDLEEVLISSDVGVKTTVKIIERIEERVKKDGYMSANELDKILKNEIASLLEESNSSSVEDFELSSAEKPYVIMVVGVNGVGKTTTIGKLANQFKLAGKKVVLGAADTFRAAAIDQLKVWGERVDVPVIAKNMNSDPASVAYTAVKEGQEMAADVVIVDTAGRLQTKIPLMNELSKIKKVMGKLSENAPHEVLLVLDGSTGQNAISQATEFTKATEVTSLAITKLDGTAKGGVVIGISDQFKIPVKYIGVGEKIDDLQLFNAQAFVESLFDKE